MTIEELIKKLEALQTHGDPESGHQEADSALLEFIGNQEVTEAFEKIRKWYS